MIGPSSARRASAFATAVDATDPGGSPPDDAPDPTGSPVAPYDGAPAGAGSDTSPQAGPHPVGEDAGLVRLTEALRSLPRATMDSEARTTQRAQLIAAMENSLQEGGDTTTAHIPGQRPARSGRGAHRAPARLNPLRPRSRLSRGLLAGGLGVGVAASALGGAAAASNQALPGDSLYRVKRGMEDLRLGMAGDDGDRGRIYLDHASTRLQEARRLMERSRTGDLDADSEREMRRTLRGLRHDAAEGRRLLGQAHRKEGTLGPLRSLDHFAQSSRSGWSTLRQQLPVRLTDVGDEVAGVLDAIDADLLGLRSADSARSPAPVRPAPPTGTAPEGSADPRREASPREDDGSPSPEGSRTKPSEGHSPSSGSGAPSSGSPTAPESPDENEGGKGPLPGLELPSLEDLFPRQDRP
ncbi:DUF5667 domain-containing protein [Streptomyces sp. NPDC005438]|uniref:DUF5667 domain-containing protein n=1 Tax=Streptomyces sp. NPDC005438 TaxID=3156880 RepID=UPI0033BAB604